MADLTWEDLQKAAAAILTKLVDPSSDVEIPAWVESVRISYSHTLCSYCKREYEDNLFHCECCS
jgi:hypothetical protein